MRSLICAAMLALATTTAGAEPETLTLECKGVSTAPNQPGLPPTMPVNFGITVDFGAGTVEGLSLAGRISSAGSTSAKISFNGEYRGDTIQSSIAGTIDRVTGACSPSCIKPSMDTGRSGITD
jgi:hypothetical protein